LSFFKLLDEFKTNPQIELNQVQKKFGTIPEFRDVLQKEKLTLVPESRAVYILLQNQDALKFDTFKGLLAASRELLSNLESKLIM
jgi:hypothetical protein